jgi:hypothetical protein
MWARCLSPADDAIPPRYPHFSLTVLKAIALHPNPIFICKTLTIFRWQHPSPFELFPASNEAQGQPVPRTSRIRLSVASQKALHKMGSLRTITKSNPAARAPRTWMRRSSAAVLPFSLQATVFDVREFRRRSGLPAQSRLYLISY